MQQYIPLMVFIIWLIFGLILVHYHSKPEKKIVEKYGQPIKHICGSKGFYSLPTRTFNSTVFIDIFNDFLIISVNNKELVIRRDYKQFDIYGSFMNFVFEIDNDGKRLQICIYAKDAKILKEWFDNIE